MQSLLAAGNASTCYPAALLYLRNPSPRTEASVSWIVVNIHWIMILSGVLTMTMVYAAYLLSVRRTPTGNLNISSVGTS